MIKGSTADGNTVEIRGTNLAEASRIEFGEAEVTILESSETAIKAVVPAHAAGAAHVRVTTIGGISGKFAADEYTYVGPQALTVTTAGSGSGSVSCDGGPCASSYPYGSAVTLSAAAASGSEFTGFSGACSGTGPCTLTIEGPTTVTATFDKEEAPLSPPLPAEAKCVVPKLAKKTLGQAKSALKAAKCALGKVIKPKKKGKLVVKSSSPAAGKTLALGSKVNLKLGPKPKRGKR